MASQTLPMTETGPTARLARRVYCEQEADAYAEDGTPLYLVWIIEGKGGELYSVPAQPGGWLRRTPYEARPDGLKPVPARKAEVIVWLTYADTDNADDVSLLAHTRYAGYAGSAESAGEL
jgi:hypothetical protein